jgi:glucokinase
MSVIALDLGGTKLAAALMNEEGEILHSAYVVLENRAGKEVAALIIDSIEELIAKGKHLDNSVTSLGICIPGIYYASTGNVWAPNIQGWEKFPLKNFLEQKFETEKILINIDSDRACSILGEYWKGNAKGCKDAIFIAVGTGIGAGIMVNGSVLRGAHDIAGATGWMALHRPYDKEYDQCGYFETQASGEGIAKQALQLILQNKYSSILTQGKHTARDVFDAYEKNDPLAIVVINNAIECWGMAVANFVSLFNPEKIIMGGGVFGPAVNFLDQIYLEAKKWAQPISIQQVKLEPSALGMHAGLMGAGFLALNNLTTHDL